MSSARLSYRERRAQARLHAPPLSPDEIDDRQVRAIESSHDTLDEWLAGDMDPEMVARLRGGLPPRITVLPTC